MDGRSPSQADRYVLRCRTSRLPEKACMILQLYSYIRLIPDASTASSGRNKNSPDVYDYREKTKVVNKSPSTAIEHSSDSDRRGRSRKAADMSEADATYTPTASLVVVERLDGSAKKAKGISLDLRRKRSSTSAASSRIKMTQVSYPGSTSTPEQLNQDFYHSADRRRNF